MNYAETEQAKKQQNKANTAAWSAALIKDLLVWNAEMTQFLERHSVGWEGDWWNMLQGTCKPY